jgi:hypothetical protein
LSKQLDRIEQRLEELTQLVGSIAWYYGETMDYLAVLDEEIMLIQGSLGIQTDRNRDVPKRPPPIEGIPPPTPEG